MKEPSLARQEFPRALLDAFDEALCLVDSAGSLVEMNAAAERLLGCGRRALVGKKFLPAPVSGASARRMRVSLGSGKDRLLEGEIRPLAGAGSAISLVRLSDPALESGRGRDSEATLRAVLDTLVDGIIVIDEQGLVQLFTPAAERMFGYHADEVLGRNVALLMPSPHREEHDAYIGRYLRTGEPRIIGIGREVQGRRKDGRLFPLHLSVGEFRRHQRRWFVGVTRDLTVRKQTEDRLLMLSSAVDQSPSGVLIADSQGCIQYVNRGYTTLTGYGAEELVGTRCSGAGRADRLGRLREVIRSGTAWRGEVQDRRRNGEVYWALESITPILDGHGEATHYLLIQQDITEQKRDKEALAESEERFRQVAEMAGEWLWEQDPEGRYLYSSAAVRAILGFEPEEVRGKHYFDLLTPEDRQHWMSALPPAKASEKPFFRLINRYRHKDGHEVYTESTGAPIFGERGELVKWRGVDHDITTRKRYEDELRVRNRAIESASVGINIADAQTKGLPNVYINPALSAITGYSKEELLHHSMRMLQGAGTDPASVEEIREAIRAGRSCRLTIRNYRKDGMPFWNELLISPVKDEAGVITHYIGIQTDVTELRRAEEERHELEIAKQIQLSLLPKAPLHLTTVEIAGFCVPATHVGGDYFDYFHRGDCVDLVIADVSGHSVGAALIMAEVRSVLRTEARRTPVEPSGGEGVAPILAGINDALHEDLSGADLFITMFYVRYDCRTRRLSYANAGHNFALLLPSGEDSCVPLDADGLVLGVRKGVSFEEKAENLQAGDWLLLYTDGVIEAQNGEGEFFGIARLCRQFSARRSLSPEAMVAGLLSELRAFAGNDPLRDDVSMVALRVR
ncbi:PAS domain S-box protein [Methylococcus capsulatus]|uniref:PAS domain S-box protein n=1 Tax=Methylococcus capsulatus TaxID=414 RepID=UPI001C52B7FB|nr:PAS domain S-box protein [Methylococcus capsulatus]QXP90991.1 PAS domain S-box protein [Methylococcus capsulatus]